MSTDRSVSDIELVLKSIFNTEPFSALSVPQKQQLVSEVKLVSCAVGDRILRPNVFSKSIFVIVEGKIRFLTDADSGSSTLDLKGRGQIIGWSSLLCAEPFEWVIASEKSILLDIPASLFIDLVNSNEIFKSYFLTGAVSKKLID